MAYTWPSFTSAEVLSGSGAKTTGQSLFDQQDALKQIRRVTLDFSQDSVNSASWTAFTASQRQLYIPAYARDGETIRFRTYARSTVGISPLIRFQIASTQSTTWAPGSSWGVSDALVLTIPGSSGWQDTVQAFELQGQVSAGNIEARGEDIFANLWVEEA